MGVMHLSSGAAPLAVLTDLASNRCFRRLARAATFAGASAAAVACLQPCDFIGEGAWRANADAKGDVSWPRVSSIPQDDASRGREVVGDELMPRGLPAPIHARNARPSRASLTR